MSLREGSLGNFRDILWRSLTGDLSEKDFIWGKKFKD